MDRRPLIRVALRQHAIFVDNPSSSPLADGAAAQRCMAFVAELRKKGFAVSEPLLRALYGLTTERLEEITGAIDEALGIRLNWAPLVKGWDTPTGESLSDHIATWFAQVLDQWGVSVSGVRLQCGHLIPEGTFPLNRYNGCPFCGTPFTTADYVFEGQGSNVKVLSLMTEGDMRKLLDDLLSSPTPLDQTQQDSLRLLIGEYGLPKDAQITIRETVALVGKILLEQDKPEVAQSLVRTPSDILRLLWFEKTGHALVIKPRTLIKNASKASHHMAPAQDKSEEAAAAERERLKLHYGRKRGRIIAKRLNEMPMTAAQACEDMNPTRGMWVRLIRALRLAEHAKREGYGRLAELLDTFYNQRYTTWSGRLERARSEGDANNVLRQLAERPGMFARCLFATMLRLGREKTLRAFGGIASLLPKRLLVSLGNAAETYFDPEERRVIKAITGKTKIIKKHPLLAQTTAEERETMIRDVRAIYVETMRQHFASQRDGEAGRTIFIDPELYDIPLGVGDRSTTVQDSSCALMGTRFKVEGDAVRLFLQWGAGLKAQHLDMDLSCAILFADGRKEDCAYFNLTATGAKHSGDIQTIPDMVGTAEYIELTLPEMEREGVRYAVFTCNAYTNGTLSPNLMVGWMSSANPMTISKTDGVAYDPSCVQHIVRIGTDNLSKGLVFGILEVAKREITWLEAPFDGQTVRSLNTTGIETYLRRLRAKTTIGEMLDVKAEAQGLVRVPNAEDADEAYTREWALNTANVSRTLLG